MSLVPPSILLFSPLFFYIPGFQCRPPSPFLPIPSYSVLSSLGAKTACEMFPSCVGQDFLYNVIPISLIVQLRRFRALSLVFLAPFISPHLFYAPLAAHFFFPLFYLSFQFLNRSNTVSL